MRVVLDTNLLVSALKKEHGTPAAVLLFLFDEPASLVISEEIFAEYQRVCSYSRLQLPEDAVSSALHLIRSRATFVVPSRTLHISSDEADNRFLECAEASRADYLITGNLRHFPVSHGGTEIVTASEFLGRLRKPSS
jgi:putative PIN family toxin of toxin-antitoxin system